MFAVSPTSPPHRTVITRRLASTFGVALIVLATLSCSKSEAADTYRVRFDPSARAEPATGRIVLFFITETRRPFDRRDPMEGPFFEKPQPIASIAVKDFNGGDVATLDGSSLAWPVSLDT